MFLVKLVFDLKGVCPHVKLMYGFTPVFFARPNGDPILLLRRVQLETQGDILLWTGLRVRVGAIFWFSLLP